MQQRSCRENRGCQAALLGTNETNPALVSVRKNAWAVFRRGEAGRWLLPNGLKSRLRQIARFGGEVTR